jgi:hypothetical protein
VGKLRNSGVIIIIIITLFSVYYLMYRVLVGKPEGKRLLGRHKLR